MPQKETILRRPGVFNYISAWFNSLFNRKYWVYGLGNREVNPDNSAEGAVVLFGSNAAVYSIVKKDCNKFAAIPRYVLDAKKLQEKHARPKDLKFKANPD